MLVLWARPVQAGTGTIQGEDRPVVIVGGDRDYPPYEFIDQNGRAAGFNVDLTKAIAEVKQVLTSGKLDYEA